MDASIIGAPPVYSGLLEVTDRSQPYGDYEFVVRGRLIPPTSLIIPVALGPVAASTDASISRIRLGRGVYIMDSVGSWYGIHRIDLDNDGVDDVRSRFKACDCNEMVYQTQVNVAGRWCTTESRLDKAAFPLAQPPDECAR